VISAGKCQVMSRSSLASKSWSITKYSRESEMSPRFSVWFVWTSVGLGILTIMDTRTNSYRRGLRRSESSSFSPYFAAKTFWLSPCFIISELLSQARNRRFIPDEPFDPEYVVVRVIRPKCPAKQLPCNICCTNKASCPHV